MPVAIHEYDHFLPPSGVPGAPVQVTSITKDAGATVSFVAPASQGGSSITSYTVTPYIGGTAQSPTTVPVASLGSITRWDGQACKQAAVTGLSNGTAYTFTVKASNSQGAGAESSQSGANTPLANLVFGDDFAGPAAGPVDPEWFIYDNRCGYLKQNEVEAYMASHCQLDGASSLKLTAEHVSQAVPRYPSDPSYPGTITQPWTSGACQGNTKLWAPSGTSMTFEVKQQVNADAGSGYWPGLFWLEGYTYLNAWKTDPDQAGWDSTGKAEIDVAEWYLTGSPDSYGTVTWAGSNNQINNSGSGLATSQHVYSATWTPGSNCVFRRDGSVTGTSSSQIPAAGASFFLLIYLQMLSGGATTTESCYIDYVRVFDNP